MRLCRDLAEKMNLLRVKNYTFQMETEDETFVQGIRWTPISDTPMENPGEPLRRGPCERAVWAARVLQNALLHTAPGLVRDRKHYLKTLRQSCTGKELVDEVMKLNPILQSRPQAVGVLQLLVEEGVLINVRQELSFVDKENQFFRFSKCQHREETSRRERDTEDELNEAMNLLTLLGPDALLTASLRK
ncbi:rap guanine nucleotide exchange factor 3-like, partial [Carcharodon carcharias]|uniref:rap guanine nucleotide exchange factor 3-like n=1 Tax=Carcharodon carcharias TaxID=13397 RepID=UPI001B7EFF52